MSLPSLLLPVDSSYVSPLSNLTPLDLPSFSQTNYQYFNDKSLAGVERYNREGKRDGMWTSYHCRMKDSDERIKTIEETWLDGKLHGTCTKWYQTGALRSITHYTNGNKNGERREYFLPGARIWSGYSPDLCADEPDLRSIENYKNGELHGEAKSYYPSSALKSHCFYQERKLEGELFQYDELGQLSAVQRYKNNILNGIYQKYAHTVLTHQITYIDDIKNGVETNYYNTGEISDTRNWVNGLKEGKEKSWYSNGQLGIICNFKNNYLHGQVIIYFLSGDVYVKCMRDNGKYIGEYKLYNIDCKEQYKLEIHRYYFHPLRNDPIILTLRLKMTLLFIKYRFQTNARKRIARYMLMVSNRRCFGLNKDLSLCIIKFLIR